MYRKTLLAISLICMFTSISQTYGQDSCSAPSCPTLTISGPDKISYWEQKYYTLTSDSSRNIRWSVDNPGAFVSGDNNGATLTVYNACDCNNGVITITAKDIETGCYDTFRVQAGTWVDIAPGRPDAGWFCDWGGCPVGDFCSSDVIVGTKRYLSSWSTCNTCAWGGYYCNIADAQVEAWRSEGGVTNGCENSLPTCSNPNCKLKPAWLSLRILDWKCPTTSQSCNSTCSISITDFKTSASSFDPYSETVCLSGLVDEATGRSVGWTIEIKDSTGLIVKQFSGGASYVAASWNGRDDNGEIVLDGNYKVVLTAKTDDGRCSVKSEIDVTVQSECRFTISTDPPEVWPKNTGSNETTANVLVTLQRPAPLGGCNIDFEVEPVEDSGGHKDHSGDRPKGTVEPASVNIPSGTEGTVNAATYTSHEIGGEEKIIAKMNGEEVAEKTIKVRVENLSTLSSGTAYRLTGQTEKHGSNHYGTNSTIVNTPKIANDFYAQFDATIGINDMSLIYGGLFDICGTYNPADTCSNAPNGGHSSHRKGTSVDIDRCAKSVISNNQYPQGDCTNGYIKVDKNEFKKICESHAGYLVREGTIHCEISR